MRRTPSRQLVIGYAGAVPVSSMTCDSYMEYDFRSFRENGQFSFVAHPIKLSVLLRNREEILTDSTRLCRIERRSIQYSVSMESDGSSRLDAVFTSSPNGDSGDGGHISISGNQDDL
jgi:hypothetical protein